MSNYNTNHMVSDDVLIVPNSSSHAPTSSLWLPSWYPLCRGKVEGFPHLLLPPGLILLQHNEQASPICAPAPSSLERGKVVSTVDTCVTRVLNPLICSMRKKELKHALFKKEEMARFLLLRTYWLFLDIVDQEAISTWKRKLNEPYRIIQKLREKRHVSVRNCCKFY